MPRKLANACWLFRTFRPTPSPDSIFADSLPPSIYSLQPGTPCCAAGFGVDTPLHLAVKATTKKSEPQSILFEPQSRPHVIPSFTGSKIDPRRTENRQSKRCANAGKRASSPSWLFLPGQQTWYITLGDSTLNVLAKFVNFFFAVLVSLDNPPNGQCCEINRRKHSNFVQCKAVRAHLYSPCKNSQRLNRRCSPGSVVSLCSLFNMGRLLRLRDNSASHAYLFSTLGLFSIELLQAHRFFVNI